MELIKKNIQDLTPAAYNPRKDLQPGDPEYEKLKRSLDEFGYVEPVIWNKRTGNVVGGHIKVLREHLGLDPAGRIGVDAIVVAEVQQADEGQASTQAAVADLPGTPKFGLDGSNSGHHAPPLRTR